MKKAVLVLIVLAIIGCKNKAETDFSKPKVVEKSELLKKAENFFKSISTIEPIAIPQNKLDLGKKLFFDKALSKNGTISCNSCHNLATFGVDNKSFSIGDTKEFGGRNSPSVIYASLHAMQFWDGRAKDVEEQAGGPLLNPVEHSLPSKEFLENKLRAIKDYQALFKIVYPNDKEPITFANITNAIGAFERQLNPKSKFDEFLDGNDNALNNQEKMGLTAFIDNGCTTCHSGVAIGGQMMQKFGLYGNYAQLTKSKKIDNGLFDRTKKEGDQFMFKVPSLRNVEKTYPYFHDGSVASLKDAIKIMGKLQVNKDLSDTDVANIETYLKTLTADVDAKYKQ
jgi:cytochrome c peroxidase